MKCPICGAAGIVTDTRAYECEQKRRRRVCDNGHVFLTVEVYAAVYPSCRARAAEFVVTMRKRRAQWARYLDIVQNYVKGYRHFMAKYGMSKSGVLRARSEMQKHAKSVGGTKLMPLEQLAVSRRLAAPQRVTPQAPPGGPKTVWRGAVESGKHLSN